MTRYKHSHFGMIADWYQKRGLPIPSPSSVGDIGWIVDNRAAGWLYITAGNIALIEGVITNPETVPSMRKQSLKTLAGLMVDNALSLGCTNIIAITKHPSIMELCEYMGFKELQDHRVFALSEAQEDDNDYLQDTFD